ncbi:hypothetical protein [Acinetobacter dispersus]|uniref:hypothetical protein n=1 Tax=Acinetobacter dispersus TaxID=70348 RepID=UPI001F4A8F18|nr:hypothetical protein [Acinetobacter dispersus]MCH7391822.1 hypothetical protein [Acinetobacter dispersus]
MSNNYPRALYRGDSIINELVFVYTKEQEDEMKQQGYMHFSELPEHVAEIEVIGQVIKPNNELAKIKQELLNALKTIEQKEDEILDLKQTYIAENNQLRQQVRFLELGDLGAGDLQKILDEKQVKYGARDSKDELVKLVFDAEYPKGE